MMYSLMLLLAVLLPISTQEDRHPALHLETDGVVSAGRKERRT